ncbi:dihydroorotase [Desulfosporosinus meridiei]|uniref:Dihydroorotase n=1 Tax=Desulfosporosinus meridiei (strain ATCC BAA-275 / DSM 13257 / KCTC 12902 / NCIMB 13706 / S10) TaxID=768704 RepID=J7IZU4_DESMD|nr:dihydroorotase [Desulfosporosinus meridiei]AFQ45649.1 dihydroorotase [Desulfosporosinus meridiei DSM 13257]
MWWLKDVMVIDPSQKISAPQDVLIKDKTVLEISSAMTEEEVIVKAQGKSVETINGKGKYLFPGLIDVHTHLREPGQEDKEDILSGARAAVRGGFTTILAMANTQPPIDNRALVEFVRRQGERAGYAHVFPIGTVTKGMQGSELVEMADMKAGGAVAFSDDGKNIQNAEMMRLALEYAKLTGFPIISHCEDKDLAGDGLMRRGVASGRMGLRGIPASAESVIVARDLILAEETGGKLHLAHISTADSVELIRKAKARGVNVTAEVNPHHLIFCDEEIGITDTVLKVNPPLGSKEDREALIEGLRDGTIDMIATDHAPHTQAEKARPFAEAPFGIASLETALSAVWNYLVLPGRLSPDRVIEAWSMAPAQRFGLNGGTLKPGAIADMVLFDPNFSEMIDSTNLVSKARNTPFLGKIMEGFPVMVWVEGKLVQRDRVVR